MDMLCVKIFGTNLGMFYFKAFWLFQNICSTLMLCVNFFCLYIHIRISGQLPMTKCCNLNRRNSNFIKGFFKKKKTRYSMRVAFTHERMEGFYKDRAGECAEWQPSVTHSTWPIQNVPSNISVISGAPQAIQSWMKFIPNLLIFK